MKHTLILIAFVLTVLLALFFLSSRKSVPPIPDDEVHRSVMSNEACITCHGPDMQQPLKASHPPKEQCLTCHKHKQKKK